jgi:teichoic acid transport system ATP-binding protein
MYKSFKISRDRANSLKDLLLIRGRSKPERHEVLNDITLDIKKGETVALIGTNGSGKSTLLKLMTKIIYPNGGTVETTGKLASLLELGAGFHQDFTGRENIYFRGQLMGLSDKEIRELEPEIVDFADLNDYIDQPVRTYSSGMKARLGFAINVNIKPEILIVDEALSVGDNEFKKKCTAKINEIINEKDVTFLFVTHSSSTARSFCKRGLVMRQGKLMYDSDIDDAIEYYQRMTEEDAAKKKGKGKGIFEQ